MEDSVMQIEHLADGTEYQVYIPKNVTSDTKIIVYEAGSGGYDSDWPPVETALKTRECDAIVLRSCFQSDHQTNRTSDALNDVIAHYSDIGISYDNVISCGHSLGGAVSVERALEIIEQNPNVGPQIITTLDGCFLFRRFSQKELELLKQNNAVVIAYYQPGYDEQNNYQKFVENGVNFIFIKDVGCRSVGDNFGPRHAAVNRRPFQWGLLNYLSGVSTMSTEGYEFYVYNKETGQLEELDIGNINTLEKLCAYYGIYNYHAMVKHLLSLNIPNVTNLSSDSNVLNNSLNSLLVHIKNMSFLTSNFGSKTYVSTTSVPSKISFVTQNFFSLNAYFLVKLSDEINQMYKIGQSFDILDKNLNNNAVSLSSQMISSNRMNMENVQNVYTKNQY